MTASKGLRPALLFLSSAASLTTASISARKLSKGTRALSASSGSPLALIASRRLSRSKKPGCPTAFPCAADVGTRESDLRRARQCYFSRCPQEITREIDRLGLVQQQIAAIEQHHNKSPTTCKETEKKRAQLLLVKGIGPTFSAVMAREVYYRQFSNRRQVAGFLGLATSPYDSGQMERSQGISRAGSG